MKHIETLEALTKSNKYTKWYIELITRAPQIRPSDGYTEGHHIVPKSIAPEIAKDHSNVVYLSAREHFVAHMLLAKMLISKRHTQKMLEALAYFSNNSNRAQKYTSRELAVIREANSKAASKRNKGNQHWKKRGPTSKKVRTMLSDQSSKSRWVNNGIEEHFTCTPHIYIDVGFTYGRLPLTAEHKASIGRATKARGDCKSDAAKKKLGKIMADRNRKLPREEQLRRISLMNAKVTCEHCGKNISKANYSRWHGDKCKLSTVSI